ncbi:transglycosylase SLT domain-containing protein [Chiayiivirga flava]|uniref:Membrane-bound lytic murein transglycosylase D n=1 Tax=Chiayiivirga flava TaxID=659595 RepID=A0A7W8D8S9_9GAMM|nr:transglycosylase SLT domain-containing protein [Chiayiivirga flava]MBB5208233.1 membrane-bound lytic murein transglycosylase D [Chiayiivirga flava]
MRWTVLLLTATLVACATPNGGAGTVAAPASEATLNAIYAQIDAASLRFDAAVALYEAGSSAAAAAEFNAARQDLRGIATRCGEAPGCDVRRVIAAQDALLERQARFLTGATEDAEPVDDDAVATPGEGDSPVTQALPQAARTVAMLNGRDLAKVIEVNEPLKAALEEWLTWMRPNLLDAWENYQFLRHQMFPAYEQAGLPEALLFGILAKESGGKVHAVSRAGAAGPLQFMPHTGARFGLNRGGAFDLRFDPRESARANVEYLNERFADLNNNLALALAAYNGGEGRLSRLSNKGAKDFWSPQVFNALPPETREYVPMVMAAAWLFLHPERYNLDFPVYDARPAKLALAGSMSLNEIAVCMGQDGNPRGWFRHLRNLNPRFDPTVRLPPGTSLDVPVGALQAFRRHCESGPMLTMSRELHEARPPVAPPASSRVAASGGGSYVVRKGDSLHSIARERGCQVGALAKSNGVAAPKYLIRPGQRLQLSGCRR